MQLDHKYPDHSDCLSGDDPLFNIENLRKLTLAPIMIGFFDVNNRAFIWQTDNIPYIYDDPSNNVKFSHNCACQIGNEGLFHPDDQPFSQNKNSVVWSATKSPDDSPDPMDPVVVCHVQLDAFTFKRINNGRWVQQRGEYIGQRQGQDIWYEDGKYSFQVGDSICSIRIDKRAEKFTAKLEKQPKTVGQLVKFGQFITAERTDPEARKAAEFVWDQLASMLDIEIVVNKTRSKNYEVLPPNGFNLDDLSPPKKTWKGKVFVDYNRLSPMKFP